jgi:hypothetical protein
LSISEENTHLHYQILLDLTSFEGCLSLFDENLSSFGLYCLSEYAIKLHCGERLILDFLLNLCYLGF